MVINAGNSDVYDQNGSSGDTTNEDLTYENEKSSRMRLDAPTTDHGPQLSPSFHHGFRQPVVGGGQDHHHHSHRDFHALWSNSSR